MRRWLLSGLLVVGASAAGYALFAGWGDRALASAEALLSGSREPIVVGLLHSRGGPMGAVEGSLVDAEILALEEINGRGGINGRPIRWVEGDGRSDPSTVAAEARRLI